MSPSSKPATVRFYIDFYIDADVLGLAKVLVALRPDVTTPAIPEDALDRVDHWAFGLV